MRFSELALHEEVMKGIEAAGFIDCMPVQEKVYPAALQGKDVMVQSKTGSGKTAVFLVTVLQKFVIARDQARSLPPEEAFKVKLPVALIIAPTRELAVQIEDDAKIFASGIPEFRIGCFYGGVGYAKQDKHITDGLDLIIGTPGRLLDYQQMGKINYKKFDSFIIDEADRLFDMGFYPDIQKMFSMMVAREQRQTMLFSATLSTKVRNLAWDYMNNPEEIEVQPEEITVKAITQELYHVSKSDKFKLFLRLLAKEKPRHALIFTNTKAKAVELCKRLEVNGYNAQYLMGDLPQSKRLQVINKMKQGELQFLVATDVAARGLQIDDLELVFNYDIPEDFESYVHRIGRTARAGKSGKSITLACEQFVYGLEAIENYIQMKIPVIWAEDNDLPEVEDKSAKMRFRDLVDESEYASSGGDGAGSRSRGSRAKGKTSDRGGSRTGGRKPVSRSDRPDSRSERPAPRQDRTAPRSDKPMVRTDRPTPRTEKTAGRQARPGYPADKPAARGAGPRDNTARTPSPSTKQEYRTSSTVRPGKSYTEIQKMDFEERIAYYKKVYGSEGSPVAQAQNPAGREPERKREPRPAGPRTDRPPQPRRTPPPHAAAAQNVPSAKPARVEPKATVEPVKKMGLLARIVKRIKGDV
ncbi:MAG: DEAD/DEAH box helicase [Spirochaetae bacterium HGW-Spirochaetae-8]|nr:MAG: DEAD/DEAH box helicase [Spirochaetae bacterium HGW-Spirochaetae-8]